MDLQLSQKPDTIFSSDPPATAQHPLFILNEPRQKSTTFWVENFLRIVKLSVQYKKYHTLNQPWVAGSPHFMFTASMSLPFQLLLNYEVCFYQEIKCISQISIMCWQSPDFEVLTLQLGQLTRSFVQNYKQEWEGILDSD